MSSEAQRRLILHMSGSLDGFSAAGRDIPGSVDHGSVRHQARARSQASPFGAIGRPSR